MIDNKIQDNTAMNGISYFFPLFSPSPCMKLRIQISDLSGVASYRASENDAVGVFSRVLIIAGLFIVSLHTSRPIIPKVERVYETKGKGLL